MVLALCAYEQIMTLFQAISIVQMLMQWLANGDLGREQQLVAYAKACFSSAYAYFQSKFERDFHPIVQAFKVAHFISPYKMCKVQPSATDINSQFHLSTHLKY